MKLTVSLIKRLIKTVNTHAEFVGSSKELSLWQLPDGGDTLDASDQSLSLKESCEMDTYKGRDIAEGIMLEVRCYVPRNPNATSSQSNKWGLYPEELIGHALVKVEHDGKLTLAGTN